MTGQNTEKRTGSQPSARALQQEVERQPASKRSRPLAGFFIAGASLALLFGIAALKGRVKDDTSG